MMKIFKADILIRLLALDSSFVGIAVGGPSF